MMTRQPLLSSTEGDRSINQLQESLSLLVSASNNSNFLQSFRTGNPEQIVDIKVSVNGNQDADLARNGYKQLFPNVFGGSSGTFGKGRSLWIWRRKQGTCYGRLKPIIDIQLLTISTSSAMVLGGYVCLSESIAGQWVWVKRAILDADEQDAILDFHVTVGRMKVPTDPIWSSPGVGWVRVEGNFGSSGSVIEFSKQDSFLWFLPSRTRGIDSVALSPLRSALALSDDMRRERILTTVRAAIRLHIPVQEMKRLTWVAPAEANSDTGMNPSVEFKLLERYSGSVSLYNKYDSSGRGHLTKARFSKLLEEIGLRIEAADVAWCFHSFSIQAGVNSDKYISLEQFAEAVKLTDNEVDLILDQVRTTLLMGPTLATSNQSSGLKSSTETIVRAAARSRLRDGRTLSRVFEAVNRSRSGILSLDELLVFASTIELYIAEDEAARLLKLLDISGANRVEESQFVEYLLRDDTVLTKKAQRVHEAASRLRQWLQRGSATGPSGTSSAHLLGAPSRQDFSSSLTAPFANVSPADFQWAEIKKRREKSLGTKFPGFICSEDLLMLLVTLGVRLSAAEARELLLLVAPNKSAWKNGRIEQGDLIAFANSSCRMFGQLDSLFGRELLKPLVSTYREIRESYRSTGSVSKDLSVRYEGIMHEITAEIKSVSDASHDPSFATSNAVSLSHTNSLSMSINLTMGLSSSAQTMGGLVKGALKPSNMVDVYSITQLKAGVEKAMAAYITAQTQLPNLEEWTSVATRLGVASTDCDVFGVRVPAILQAICEHLVGKLDEPHSSEKHTTESLRRDLQAMILAEATHGSPNVAKPNWEAAFSLFDENSDGRVSSDEFKKLLGRWKLLGQLSDQNMTDLVATFDTVDKGSFDFADFMRFMNMEIHDGHGHEVLVEGEPEKEEDELSFSCNIPPVAVTGNASCDWLLWFLWKEAVQVDPSDPEGVLAEVEARCGEMQYSLNQDTIRVKDLWRVLVDARIKGILTKSQFAKCIVHLTEAPDHSPGTVGKSLADDNDSVDFESLVRFSIRMGRTYNNMVLERDQSDDALFNQLLPKLKRDFTLMCPVGTTSREDTSGHGNSRQRHLKQITPVALMEAPKFQQVLRRLDRDGDGRVTCAEFKLAMRKLGLKHEPQWTSRLLQRFFDVVDPRGVYGFLAITHLVDYIQHCADSRCDGEPIGRQVAASVGMSDTARSTLAATASQGRTTSLSDSQLLSQTQPLRRTLQETENSKTTRPFNGTKTKVSAEQSEAVLHRLSDAASRSTAAGRPFLGLCSLIDVVGVGTITPDELVTVAKMMDCVLSKIDIDALREIVPASVAVRKSGVIDYSQLNALLHRSSAGANADSNGTLGSSWQTANLHQLPYHSPGRQTNDSRTSDNRRFTLTGPVILQSREPSVSPSRRSGQGAETPRISPVYERVISAIADVIHQRTTGRGGPYSLRRQCESYDPKRSGLIQSYRFQTVLADLGVALTASDAQTLSAVYGCLDCPDHINYESFCRDTVDNFGYNGIGHSPPVESSRASPSRFISGTQSQLNLSRSQTSQHSARSAADTAAASISHNPRVLHKLQELRANGVDLRNSFASYDVNNTGLIQVQRFREVVQRLQFLSSEHQIRQVIAQFACLHNSDMVAYDDFCDSLDLASQESTRGRSLSASSGLEGLYADIEHRRPEDESVLRSQHSSPQKIRQPERGQKTPATSPEDLEPGSESVEKNGPSVTCNGGFTSAQPKLSDAIVFKRTGVPTRSHHSSRNRVQEGYFDDSELSADSRYSAEGAFWLANTPHLQDSRLFVPPRFHPRAPASPSRPASSLLPARVRSTHYTPSSAAPMPSRQKLHEELWCCAVCLFMENPSSARKCAVCESPNRGVYKMKDECLQCSFPSSDATDLSDRHTKASPRAVDKSDRPRHRINSEIPEAKQSSSEYKK